MLYTPETEQKIEVFRRKSIDGTITLEEMREAISLLRGARKAASVTSTARKSASAPRSAEALLDGLMNLDGG